MQSVTIDIQVTVAMITPVSNNDLRYAKCRRADIHLVDRTDAHQETEYGEDTDV